jgi:hypothetical protein
VNEIGSPLDQIRDDISDRPGADRDNDRQPDRGNRDGDGDGTPDREAPSRNRDEEPDCGDGPGDGRCSDSPNQGDATPDNFGPGDVADDAKPDVPRSVNRIGENVHDAIPDRANRDLANRFDPAVRDRQGNRDCLRKDLPAGECDRNTFNSPRDGVLPSCFDCPKGGRDREGRDGNPNADWKLDGSTADGSPDRTSAMIAANADDPRRPERDGDGRGKDGDAEPSRTQPSFRDSPNHDADPDRPRDVGRVNHDQPARDTFLTGPADRSKDDKADHGALGFPQQLESQEDKDDKNAFGCSFTGGASSRPIATAAAQLLALLLPLAFGGLARAARWRQHR